MEPDIETAVAFVADLLRRHGFTLEFVASKDPTGIRVIYELTDDEFNQAIEHAKQVYRDGSK